MRESNASMHGYYQVSYENNIVIATLKGAWNENTAHAFSDDFKLEASALVANNWGHIVYLCDWEMGVPGVDKILESLVAWCIDNGLTHAAHVVGKSKITEKYAGKIVHSKDQIFTKQVFHDEQQALQWLSEFDYTLK
ncbi:hypothetical protein LP316_03850 [Thalassotalea sp. LPB0316]|uniref:hypothetical protein n=1 Tax=Thalassotalea sp. LPB0316 TaxID=2769490 RepID=UPI001865CCFE|nr:hypothetical protein [Thalassotalea sp. LPB0316]QOL26444.1 hypothetical protein LP316_03850 [Thalassotalea sp. LPB0316]